MNNELYSDHISRLMAEFVQGTISDEDMARLRAWSEMSPHNKALFKRFENKDKFAQELDKMSSFDVQAGWEAVSSRYRRKMVRRISYWAGGIAAVVPLIVGLTLLITKQQTEHVQKQGVVAQSVESNAVKFRRASGEVFTLDSSRRIDLLDVVAESGPGQMTVKVANRKLSAFKTTYSTLEVPVGKQFEVTLEDGSHVKLNAGSSFRFPEQFLANAPREVYLTGEAYLTVSKDEKRPFIVHTRDSYIKVTGTQFNVCCYEDMPTQLTTLVSGSVRVGKDLKGEMVLTPGRQASLNIMSGRVETYAVDVSEQTAWMQGLFAFRAQSLEQIMQSVSRWYGCHVVFENPLRKHNIYTGKIPRNCTLEQVVNFFNQTKDVDINVVSDNVVIR